MLKRKFVSNTENKHQKHGLTGQRIVGRNVRNELLALQMMPAIIRKLKAHKLSAFETAVLRNRFGDLWHLIVDESKRSPADEMNPILSTLLRAQQTSSNGENSNAINNDVKYDFVKKIGQRQRLTMSNRLSMRLAKLRMTNDLTPAQRLLKVAAILIHESLSKKINEVAPSTHKRHGTSRNVRHRHNRVHKKQLHQLSGQDLSALKMKFNQPEAILNDMRQKRSLKYSENSDNDEVAMKLLAKMIEPNEAKEDIDDKIDGDDDYTYDDVTEKSASKDKQKKKDDKNRHKPTDQKKQTQQLKHEQQTKQANFIKTDDYKDYAFDTTDTDRFDEDEDLLRNFYGPKRRSAYDDYDYSSFSDLMHLAAKHTLRAQREDKYLSRLHFDDYLNDDANDYDDDDDDDDA